MSKEIKFLSGGLFDKDFMQTKIKSNKMSSLEKWLGYGIGPGFVAVYTGMVTSLREMFYMSVMPLDAWYGTGTYMSIQTVSSIIGIILGILVSFMTERTVSRSGRFRPYVLMGTILMALNGIGMFWSPFPNASTATLIWLWIVNIGYLCIGTTLFNQYVNVVSVSTRDLKDRNLVTSIRGNVVTMIPGMFCALLVSGWLYYVFLVNDQTGFWWRIFIAVPAVVGIGAAFIEYFYTRERITEQNREVNQTISDEDKANFWSQLKKLATNKYFLLSLVATAFYTFGANLQGVNARTYYCQYILGANDQNGIASLYLIMAYQPVAIGAFLVPILANKHGARKIMMIFSFIVFAGVAVGFMDPANFGIAILAGLIFGFGTSAVNNLYPVISQQAADMVEYEHHFRVEGTLVGTLVAAVVNMLLSPSTAIYETVLHALGFQAYEAVQNEAVNSWITFTFYGGYALQAFGVLLVLIFFTAEKMMPKVHAELKERRKAAALAAGQEWVDEEALEAAAAEELRIEKLRKKCAKKGKDFETENEKYLAKLEKKSKVKK